MQIELSHCVTDPDAPRFMVDVGVHLELGPMLQRSISRILLRVPDHDVIRAVTREYKARSVGELTYAIHNGIPYAFPTEQSYREFIEHLHLVAMAYPDSAYVYVFYAMALILIEQLDLMREHAFFATRLDESCKTAHLLFHVLNRCWLMGTPVHVSSLFSMIVNA